MQPKEKQELAFAKLADFLFARKSEIIARWLATTQKDPGIPATNKLSSLQLTDHMPAILDEICELFRDFDNPGQNQVVNQLARIHGHYRWQQGYQLDELIRELQSARKI